MNFFGVSDYLNVVEAKSKSPYDEVTVKTISLHSSEEELENNESSNSSVGKHGSLSRQQKSSHRLKNRKNNNEFRSVWYDEETEYDDIADLPASNEYLGKGLMRKAVSLDNLLEINIRHKYKSPLTKKMISSPICPRKIEGYWINTKDVPSTHVLQTDETIAGKNLPENEGDVNINVDRMEAPPPENTENIEFNISEFNTLNKDNDNSGMKKAFSLENLFSFSTLDNRSKKKNSLDLDIMEMQPLGPQSEPEVSESKLTQADDVSVTSVKSIDNKAEMKVVPRLENALKTNTLDNKTKRRNLLKLDISAPTLPRKIEGSGKVIALDSLDTEGVTNLLRMKNISKSTDELLKSFNQNEKLERANDPKFPLSESDEIDNDVQIRTHRNINQYRYSKTTDFDFGRKHTSNNRDFEIKACTKIMISNESSPIKLKKHEVIKYQNGHFYRIDENSKKIIRANVHLKNVRLLSKRDVELKDANNLSYILFFESSKDAKLFVESEKVSCYMDNDNKSTITKTLLRLLGKRSSREVLEKKGIYQNEPIFGNTLRDIYRLEKGVPKFILKTMELIERPENITSLGVYRTSGNLATIQKIRFEVDKGRLDILNEFCKDVDVLTGCLKLFFRELKEPLIPYEICDSLLDITKAGRSYSKKDRDKIRSIISKLPESNSETLYVLISHLIKVVKYKEENKMDTYNLSVCWGPTIIFITDSMEHANGKDIVTQSTDATRLFDSLLMFYIENPEELDTSRKKQDHGEHKGTIQRQDSRDSIRSSDSNNSKTQKKSASNLSLNIDEVIKKSIELIELNINSEGLYKKSGSTEKISKMMKKMTKKKISELEKYKYDVHELTDSLKKYLRELPDPLATKEVVEQVNKFCDITPCLEPNNRQKIISVVEDIPKKDTLIYLTMHMIKVIEHQSSHNVSKADMISIWTNVLNYQKRIVDSNENFSNFLRILLDVFDDAKPDAPTTPMNISNGLLNDLKNYQKDKDRCSKYDNVPDVEVGSLKEATILEEKTEVEFTKL